MIYLIKSFLVNMSQWGCRQDLLSKYILGKLASCQGINSLCTGLVFRKNKWIRHIWIFYHLVRVLVVEIVPHGRKRPRYSIVNIMAADDLAPCVARASAAMLMILLSRNIPTLASVDNILPPSNALTLKWLGHFFKMWFHFLMLFTLCAIFFFIKLVQYNQCLVSIVVTDGLVL